MPVKTKISYHIIPDWTAVIKSACVSQIAIPLLFLNKLNFQYLKKEKKNNKCWQGCGEKRMLVYCWWEWKLLQSIMENSMEVPQKIKTRTITIWPSNSTPGHLATGNEITVLKKYMPSYVCAKPLQSCLTLCDPMDCSLPGSSVHGDSAGKNTGVVAMPSSRRSSQPREQTQVKHMNFEPHFVTYVITYI